MSTHKSRQSHRVWASNVWQATHWPSIGYAVSHCSLHMVKFGSPASFEQLAHSGLRNSSWHIQQSWWLDRWTLQWYQSGLRALAAVKYCVACTDNLRCCWAPSDHIYGHYLPTLRAQEVKLDMVQWFMRSFTADAKAYLTQLQNAVKAVSTRLMSKSWPGTRLRHGHAYLWWKW